MATNMDQTTQLLCRTTELEVELRLVKQQLDQAHKSTAYLLERISVAETPRTINHELQQLSKEHEHVLRENAQLKEMLTLTREGRLPTSRRIGSRTSYGVRRTLRSGHSHSPTYKYHRATESAASELGNLLDLEDESSPTATATPAYITTREPTPPLDSSEDEAAHFSDIPEAVGRPIRRKKLSNTAIGLGISGTAPLDSQGTQISQAHADTSHPSAAARKSGFYVYSGDGNRTWFSTPSPSFDSPPKEPRSDKYQPSGPLPFFEYEHKRLMGAATFIEDMDEAQEEESWEDQARLFPRHSAQEYRKYYYETVRPAFLAKQSPKVAEGKVQQEVPKDEVARKQEDTLKPIPETCFTSGTTNADEIQLEDEEELLVDSSFNTTSSADGGVAVVQAEDAALEEAKASERAQHDSTRAASTHGSESTIRPPPTAAPPVNPLSLSIYADPAPSFSEHEPIASIGDGNAAVALEDPPTSNPRPTNPWSSGPAYYASMAESKSFASTATPGGQRSRPRVQLAEEENVVAPPTPAFGSITPSNESGSRPPRRESPLTRCGFFRGYYPMDRKQLFYKPRAEDPNALRTVVISNVPATFTLAQVLNTVRGGRIISSAYHETAAFRTTPPVTSNTVTIIFLKGIEASKFVTYTQSHPVEFTTSLLDPPTEASVTLLTTPTRPIPDRLLHQGIPYGLTRILYIHNLPPKLKEANDIINKIQSIYSDLPRPLTAGYDKDGVMVFEYASMMEADLAWRIINHHPHEFSGVSKGFLPDPCDRAVPKARGGGKGGERNSEEVDEGEGGDENVAGGGELDLSKSRGGEECEVRKDSVVEAGGGISEMVYVDREEDAKMMEG